MKRRSELHLEDILTDRVLEDDLIETPLTAPITSNPEWNRAYAERTALGRWAHADELAGPIVFLASDASAYVTGDSIRVMGGRVIG